LASAFLVAVGIKKMAMAIAMAIWSKGGRTQEAGGGRQDAEIERLEVRG
jgi:hypothetical protein